MEVCGPAGGGGSGGLLCTGRRWGGGGTGLGAKQQLKTVLLQQNLACLKHPSERRKENDKMDMGEAWVWEGSLTAQVGGGLFPQCMQTAMYALVLGICHKDSVSVPVGTSRGTHGFDF